MSHLKELGAAAGAALAIFGLWAWLGIATSGDLERLDCKYSRAAVAAYESKHLNLLSVPPPADPRNRIAWERVLKETEESLKAATDRRIKCGS